MLDLKVINSVLAQLEEEGAKIFLKRSDGRLSFIPNIQIKIPRKLPE